MHPFTLHKPIAGSGYMDLAFLGAGALGGIGLVAALVMAIVMDGGKVRPSERAARAPDGARGMKANRR